MHSVQNSFWEWMNALGPGERIPVIILGIFAFVFMVTVFSGTIYKMHKNRLDDSLKRELLDRGISADEIAKVIETATSPEAAAARWIASWGKSKTP